MFVRSKENTMVDWDEEINEAKSSRTIAIDGENSRSFIKSADFNGDGRIDFVRGSYIFTIWVTISSFLALMLEQFILPT